MCTLESLRKIILFILARKTLAKKKKKQFNLKSICKNDYKIKRKRTLLCRLYYLCETF